MKKQLFYTIILGVGLISPLVVHAEIALLVKTLKAGMKDKEVVLLQTILNKNTETRVAAFGAGSAGNETDYFGAGTREAVKKFQALHADQILIPVGLNAPTGVVGSLTRAVLNSMITGDTLAPGELQGDDALFADPTLDEHILTEAEMSAKQNAIMSRVAALKERMEAKQKDLQVEAKQVLAKVEETNQITKMARENYEKSKNLNTDLLVSGDATKSLSMQVIMPFILKSGSQMKIIGSGFEDGMQLVINERKTQLAVQSPQIATGVLPSDFMDGTYDAYLLKGSAQSSKMRILVRNPPSGATEIPLSRDVVIESTIPSKGNVGTNITLTGKGFGKTNKIITPFRTYENVMSSDGKTIAFTLLGDPKDTTLSKIQPGITAFVLVVNEKGMSNPGFIVIE